MSRFLFDTSVLIDYINRNNQDAVSYVEAVIDGSESGCYSVITEAELWMGIRNELEEATTVALLSRFESIPLTSTMARLAGSLLHGKSHGEMGAHFGDALIAATAIQVGETILTADRRSELVFGNQAQYLVYR